MRRYFLSSTDFCFSGLIKINNHAAENRYPNQIRNNSTNYFELIKEFHLGIQLFSEKPHCKTIKTKAVVTKEAAGY